jgi:hypothetical protein
MGLITPSPSGSRQTPTTPLLASSAALDFVKPKSPPDNREFKTPSGNGAKNVQENNAQVSKRDASNSSPAIVKEPTKMSKELSHVKFALNNEESFWTTLGIRR